MADLSTHYKEISPEQTVKNVKKFFESHGLRLEEMDVNQSEAGTWYCHVDVYKGDTKLEGANGKGVSYEYAMASGYAELYERFCNGMAFLGNPWWNYTVLKENQEKNNYYLRADEKILTYDELIHNCYRTEDFLSFFCHEYEDLKKAIIDYITDGKYIGLPMKNVDNEDDILYMDPRLLLRITNSVGMAAGNTLDEALNQGISELMEKQAQQHLFANWDIPHYALRLENIQNEKLQEIIKNIKALGYELYLFDLSYNFNVPVMMSLLVDKVKNNLNINFGSFPVFEIAAERVLTELYQGVQSYRNNNYLMRLQVPFRSLSEQQINMKYCNSISGEIFPEHFFNNIEYKDSYNKEVFVDKNLNNTQIREYYCELAKKLSLKFYYLNNSLSSDIYAVHILCDGISAYTDHDMYIISWDKIKKEQAKNCLKKLTGFYKGIYNNKVNFSEFFEMMQLLQDPQVSALTGKIRMWNDFCIAENNGQQYDNFRSLLSSNENGIMLNFMDQNISFDVIKVFLYKTFKCYLQLKAYVKTGKYSKEEILNIFNNVFNYNITKEDIQNCSNNIYILKKAYIEPMYYFLHSKDYDEIINMFIK